MIIIIAAVGKNLELGYKNQLLWHLKEDMDYFKKVTTGSIVVMGRKTFESIGRPLPNRENIVISKSIKYIDGVKIIDDPHKILEYNGKIFIIGGEQIYKFFLPYADKIYLTEIDKEALADSFFPEFNKNDYTEEIVGRGSDNDIDYTFKIYHKK